MGPGGKPAIQAVQREFRAYRRYALASPYGVVQIETYLQFVVLVCSARTPPLPATPVPRPRNTRADWEKRTCCRRLESIPRKQVLLFSFFFFLFSFPRPPQASSSLFSFHFSLNIPQPQAQKQGGEEDAGDEADPVGFRAHLQHMVQEEAAGHGDDPVGAQGGIKGSLDVLVGPQDTLDGGCGAVTELKAHGKRQEMLHGFHQMGILRVKSGNQRPAQVQAHGKDRADEQVGYAAGAGIDPGLGKIPGAYIGAYDDGQGNGEAEGYHVQQVAEAHGGLVGRYGNGPEAGHQQAFHAEDAGLHQDGYAHGDAHPQVLMDMAPGKALPDGKGAIAPEHLQAQDHQGESPQQQPAGQGRAQAGCRNKKESMFRTGWRPAGS